MNTKILLIDDDARIVHTFARILKLAGYIVITADSGQDGLASYHRERPDIVLLDLKMPGMDGLAVLQAVREHDPEANVILTTGHGDKDAVIDALRAGASDFLSKPIDQVSLESALRRAEEHVHLKRKLRASQEALRRQNERLEEQVKARTAALEREIEERKQAQEALRESKRLLERTFASLRDAVFVIDAATTQIFDCNPAASRMFGYRHEEILGRTIDFLHIDAAALEQFRSHLHPIIEEKGFLPSLQFRMKRRNGTIFPTEHCVTPLEDEQGRRIGWVSVVRDITEHKRIEEALQESEYKLSSIIEQLPISIVLCDEEGTIIKWNTAQERLSGISEDEALGKFMWDVAFRMAPEERHTPEAYERTKAVMQQLFRTGQVTWPQQAQVQIIERPDGTHCIVETEVFTVETERGFICCSITRDVIERKREEERLRARADRMDQTVEELEKFKRGQTAREAPAARDEPGG